MQHSVILYAGDAGTVPSDDARISKAYAGKPVPSEVVYSASGSRQGSGDEITFSVVPFGAAGGSVTIEHTFDDPFQSQPIQWLKSSQVYPNRDPNGPNPVAPEVLTDDGFSANYFMPVRAIRFTVTGGAARITLNQAV